MMGILTSMQEVIIPIIQTYIRYRHPFLIGQLEKGDDSEYMSE